MRTIILAAGEGTRLRPHTLTRPKCLVELLGRPLLDHQLDTLRTCGIDDITLVTGYRSEMLEARGFSTRHNPDYDSTNMVTSLMCAADLLDGSDDVLLAYADIVYEPKVLRALLDCDAPLAITIDRDWEKLWGLRLDNPLEDAETLKLDREENVTELGKKPLSIDEVEGQYMGLIKIRADFAKEWVRFYAGLDSERTYDGKDLPNMYMTSFLQELIDTHHPIRSVPIHGGWLEVDTTEDLAIYEGLAKRGELADFCRLSA